MDAAITLSTFAIFSLTSLSEAIQCGQTYCKHNEFCCAVNHPHCCYHGDNSCCSSDSFFALSWFWLLLILVVILSCGCCCCYQRRGYSSQGYAVLGREESSYDYGSISPTIGTTEHPYQGHAVVSPPPYEAVATAPPSVPPDQPPPAYSVK
ncbi:uncharacterized protein LOC144453224 [Glandiceps talaboti]